MLDPSTFADLVPSGLRHRSGAVFYSGRAAFTGPRPLYLLGLNPGGDPEAQAHETIGRDLAQWQNGEERWSAYIDRSWRGAEVGTYGIQPRIRHLFDRLDIDLRDTPSANVIFLRTKDEASLASSKQSLLNECWPVHRTIIDMLGIQTVICLGGTAGRWVRSLLGAEELVGRFVETNSRRWPSEAHVNAGGTRVLNLTHPGRADWRNANADPTPLVRDLLEL